MKLKTLLFTALASFGVWNANAQSPAGDSFFVDYDLFQQNNIVHYINSGNDASLMPTDGLSMEVWVRVQSPAWNQKIINRTTCNNKHMH
ncbi:MAG: hypothetical protein ACPGWM_09515, partial [Flavobacteriales bacterium]